MKRIVLAFAVFAVPTIAAAQDYKCQTGGKVYVAQYPCPGNEAKEAPRPVYAPVPRAPDPKPSSTQGLAESPLVRQSTAMIAAALAGGDFAKAERLAVTAEQWNMIAAARRQASSEAATRTPRRAPQPKEADNEKHLVHTDQGWDRKTNAEIAADEKRKAEGPQDCYVPPGGGLINCYPR